MAVDIFTDSELKDRFGTPELKSVGGGQFKVTNGWDKQNLIVAFVPQFVGVPVLGQISTGKISFHKKASPQLIAGFQAVENANLKSKILSYEGSYNPRLIAGTNKVSRHTYAIAIDINGKYNPYKKTPAAKGSKGSLHEIADVLKDFGFGWGGNFNPPYVDGMHFEVIRLLTKEEIAAQMEKYGGSSGVQLFIGDKKKDVTISVKDGISFARLGKLTAAIGETAEPGNQNMLVPVRQFLKGNGYAVDFDHKKGPSGAIIATKI
ncbi:MAG: M15 family metallopeptidase [Armatimonadetes bacterium]|nr:M15 family metallopeptidase [Armatimonadota bacterium]